MDEKQQRGLEALATLAKIKKAREAATMLRLFDAAQFLKAFATSQRIQMSELEIMQWVMNHFEKSQ